MPTEGSPLLDDAPPGSPASPIYLCFRERKTALIFTMCLVFFSIFVKEGANTTLPASLPPLRRLNYTDLAERLPGTGTGFYAIGKFSQVYMTYTLGGRTTLASAAALSSVGQMFLASGEMALMPVGAAISAYANAHFWGASTRITASWADQEDIGRAVGWFLAIANDVGIGFFSAVFAALQRTFPYATKPRLHAFAPYFLMVVLLNIVAVLVSTLLRSSAVDAGFAPPRLLSNKSGGSSSAGISISSSSSGSGARDGGGESAGGGGAGGSSKGGGGSSRSSKGGAGTLPAGRATEGAGVALVAGEHPLDRLSLVSALRSLFSDSRIVGAVSMAVSATLAYTGGTYITTYATIHLGKTDDAATMLNLYFGLGCIGGGICVGLVRDILRPASPVRLHILLTAVGAAMVTTVLALHFTDQRATLSSLFPLLLLVQGFCLTWFNANLAIWAIRFAGPVHAATIAGALDCISCTFGIPFQFFLGHVVIGDEEFSLYLALTAVSFLANILIGTVLFGVDETMPPHAQAYAEPRPRRASAGFPEISEAPQPRSR